MYLVGRLESGEMVGCIRGVFSVEEDGELVCECGPIATAPAMQGQGFGSHMINECERRAVAERGVKFLQITVVNWRTDVIPFYHKRGFVDVGTKPFRQPGHTLEESCLSRESHFIVMRKKVSDQ